MKTPINPTAKHILSLFSLLLLTPLMTGAQTSAISVDRVNYFSQTAASTVTPQTLPFTLNVHIRGGTTNMSTWGPAFYKPGSGGVPQSGTNSATNTGTLNFPATPNNGGSFMFSHDFATNAALQSFYPVAPTDGGAYGIKFQGSLPPTPASFTGGLLFASGTTYPSVTPQITAATNGAVWSGNTLRISPTGITTLSFNAFPEYNSTPYGSFIAIGIYSNSEGVVDEASAESYYLPVGDSSVPPVVPVNQPAITQLSIDGSWLTPGVTYTMELQYAILAGQPEEANLNGQEFQGLATYRKLTLVNITVPSQEPVELDLGADFNGDSKSDLIWQHPTDGRVVTWHMNGTTMSSFAVITTQPDWQIRGSGDFNGDGKSDLIWQNPDPADARVITWQMDGTTMSSFTIITAQPTLQVRGSGDFNGDGKSDLIWQNPTTGQVLVWLMNGTTMSSSVVVTTQPSLQVRGSGDFNNDGKSDLLWQNPTTGQVVVWLMNGTTMTSSVVITTQPDWRICGSGDFNSDGKSDLLWQNPSDGRVVVWQLDGTTMTAFTVVTTQPDWRIVNH